jgi:ppGpp synthetase/RelA/SpoT-type nucleotidyltranferase
MATSRSRVTRAGARLRAHRLGVESLDPDQYVAERAIVEEFRAKHAQSLTRVAAGLRYYVKEAADGQTWSVGQRLKAMPTILDKLTRHPNMELARMQDIGGCRGILPNQAAVDHVIARLRRRWKLRDKISDYVEVPKRDGYRAKHVVAIKDGVLIEVQLRTSAQHRWAELVERFDRTHRLELKAGRASTGVRDLFAAISELIRLQENGLLSDAEFMQRMQELASSDDAQRSKA